MTMTWAKTPPSFVRTPSGDEIVILQREDYDRLVEVAGANEDEIRDEDDEDLDIAQRREAEWVASGKPVVPMAVLKLVRAGDTYMRAFRKHRGLTQEELAARTGIAQGFLSDVEGARKNASMTSLRKIATALEMHITFLMSLAESTGADQLARTASTPRKRR